MTTPLAFTVLIGNCMVHSRAVMQFGDGWCQDCFNDWHWDAERRLNSIIARRTETSTLDKQGEAR